MNQIKFEVVLDASNAAVMSATLQFLSDLAASGNSGQAKVMPNAEPAKEETKPVVDFKKASAKKKAAAPVPEEEPEQLESRAPELLKDETADEPEGDAPTIEEVRKALAPKTEEFREQIKAKLTQLGAKNVTTLEPKHYAEFKDFLDEL